MLLLAVQHKLFHLDENVIVDFIVALRMFTRSIILKRRVKDLQLGVKSYQKKLNITKPQKTFLEIEFKEPYTPSYDPPRIVYEDLDKQKRVLRADDRVIQIKSSNKKCTVNAEVFRTVLDICPRVEGVDFTECPDDDTCTSPFLIDLGYKGPLYKHTNMFVDYMHHPWRTLATLINKCLFPGKTESEIAYQIDHVKEKRSNLKTCHIPRFTKIIINHFLKQHKSLTNLNFQHCHTIKDDGIVSRLKFVKIDVHQVFYWSDSPQEEKRQRFPKKDDKDGDVDDEGDDHIIDTQDADNEDVETESDEDDIYKNKILCAQGWRIEEILMLKLKIVIKVLVINSLNFLLILLCIRLKMKTYMDREFADTVQRTIVKDHKRKHDDDEDNYDKDPLTGPNQGKLTKRRRTKEFESSKKPSTTKETPKGKTLTKGSKTGKSTSIKEPVEEPITEVIMDDVGDDVVRDGDQPQDTSEPKTRKILNPDWFKQPPRPPTLDPEWNKRHVVLDQPIQPWLNQMVSASKDHLTFNDLMATPVDFSKHLSSSIELEYNFKECFNALTNKLDWNNPEGDRYLFDLSKPLPLQGPPGHRTVVADYFFNNDLEYLKTSDPEVTYTLSITKIKAAWYEIKGIEDIVPTLWSTIKHTYDKDAEKGIKH
ncbi:hypothetical protein Tco_0519982 [Tanacetum coccineum]